MQENEPDQVFYKRVSEEQPSKTQVRFWIATIYEVGKPLELSHHFNYIAYQLERCPSTGRLHFQCYFETTRRCRRTTIVAWGDPWNKAFLAPRRGTQEQAIKYVTKDSTRIAGPWHLGEKSNDFQGKRNDLAEIQAKIDAPECDLSEIWRDNFTTMVRNHKGISEYMRFKEARQAIELERQMPTITILWGDTNVGKSHRVWQRAKERETDGYEKGVYRHFHTQAGFFNGYYGQEIILFDEFDGEIKLPEILQLCDKWPYSVNIKGGHQQWRAKEIFFTSNNPPCDWWPNSSQKHQQAFVRRIRDGKREDRGGIFFCARRGETVPVGFADGRTVAQQKTILQRQLLGLEPREMVAEQVESLESKEEEPYFLANCNRCQGSHLSNYICQQ